MSLINLSSIYNIIETLALLTSTTHMCIDCCTELACSTQNYCNKGLCFSFSSHACVHVHVRVCVYVYLSWFRVNIVEIQRVENIVDVALDYCGPALQRTLEGGGERERERGGG